jgi:hypothetical protein
LSAEFIDFFFSNLGMVHGQAVPFVAPSATHAATNQAVCFSIVDGTLKEALSPPHQDPDVSLRGLP